MGNNPSILLLSKNAGLTSFASLYPVKRHVDPKVGHAGTLDKFAEGLMIALTGAMTRLNPLFSGMDKEYVATILFGEETDTLDPEGKVVAVAEIPALETIQTRIVSTFIGDLTQTPPQYSAVHIGGRRAYSLARNGMEVEMPERPIRIHSFEVVSWESPRLVARIAVSKGTYIRSIARDLGKACGSCARLERLVRTKIGPYELDEAVDPDDTEALKASVSLTAELLDRLPGCGRIVVADAALFPLGNGCIPRASDILDAETSIEDRYACLCSQDGTLRAVAALSGRDRIERIVAQIEPQRTRL